ncbi:hypothetical protein LINGRAPRIM_LOCUS3047, partial [Linum grandiflorum]
MVDIELHGPVKSLYVLLSQNPKAHFPSNGVSATIIIWCSTETIINVKLA